MALDFCVRIMYNMRMKKIDIREKFKSLFDADKKSLALWFIIDFVFIGVWLAIDLLTKEFVYGPIANGAPDIIIWEGVLRLTSVENTGASFGIFQGKTDILTIISIITIIIMLVVMVLSIKNRNGWYRSALILLIAGGIGNIVDRLMLSYVRDWIYFELIDFAVFNLADTGLTVGCVLLIIYVIFFYKPQEKAKK